MSATLAEEDLKRLEKRCPLRCDFSQAMNDLKREPPITSREMYQRGYAAAERDLKREHLDEIEDLKVLIECLKQQLTEKIAHIELEQQRHRNITAKEKIESFRSGYFRATRDLKHEPLSEATLQRLYTEAFCCQGNINTNFARLIEEEHGIGIVE